MIITKIYQSHVSNLITVEFLGKYSRDVLNESLQEHLPNIKGEVKSIFPSDGLGYRKLIYRTYDTTKEFG